MSTLKKIRNSLNCIIISRSFGLGEYHLTIALLFKPHVSPHRILKFLVYLLQLIFSLRHTTLTFVFVNNTTRPFSTSNVPHTSNICYIRLYTMFPIVTCTSCQPRLTLMFAYVYLWTSYYLISIQACHIQLYPHTIPDTFI